MGLMRWIGLISLPILACCTPTYRGSDDRAEIINAVLNSENSQFAANHKPCLADEISGFQEAESDELPKEDVSIKKDYISDIRGFNKLFKICGSSNTGYIALSGPKITGPTAMIEVGWHCGALCGEGRLYSLRKIDSTWVVVEQHMSWVS